MKWGWLFKTYVQWHAIAFLLSELCVRTKGEAVERAWRALEATAGRWWFPLNTCATNKNQPSCLWKPLRKLLAKAKAARQRELALERASAAIRNGQQMFPGFPQGLEEMSLPPLSVNQPSPESLDKLLRPAGPRLGEIRPSSSQSSWPNSPSLPNGQRPLPNTISQPNGFNGSQTPVGNRSVDGTQSVQTSKPQDFSELLNLNFDSVIRGVMDDIHLDGTPMDGSPYNTDFSPAANSVQGAQLPNPTSGPSNTTNSTANAMQGAYGTFGDAAFSNMVGFADTSSTMGQNTESPVLEGGNMDWTMWDDMVNQYGIEGQTNLNTMNPASNIGLVNWF